MIEWVTTKQFCDALGVKRSKFYELRKAPWFPEPECVTKTALWRRSAVDAAVMIFIQTEKSKLARGARAERPTVAPPILSDDSETLRARSDVRELIKSGNASVAEILGYWDRWLADFSRACRDDYRRGFGARK